MIEIGLDPVLFRVGAFEFRWYGVAVLVAIVVVVVWGIRGARKAGISVDTAVTAAIVGIPSGFIISRGLHIVDQLDYYMTHPGQIVGFEGLTIYGAVLGATLGIFIYGRFVRLPFARLADIMAPGIILAQAIGRVGCIINGCCYGTVSSLPWAFNYTHPNSYAPFGVGVHPEVLYELLMDLVIFGVLLALRGRFRANGSLYAFYIAIYSFGRFFLDFLRWPEVSGLHQAQYIALIVLVVAVPFLVVANLRARRQGLAAGAVAETEGDIPPQAEA
ncbi:MAG TPA: prolipoprotein diacylglyceryl transferase [Dehalococcoidia bacterium]|nr:prolipoprotein diacylglyceryl transferase [Dehalococcoidia bacterium]